MPNPTLEQEGNFSLEPINAIESMSRAEIDVQIATAKKYPRSLSKVKNDMLAMATLDEETAASCFYNLPRGGKNIIGPSVRLAEIAFACFGNVSSVTRVIETVTDGAAPYVAVQSICKDLEKNNTVGMEKRRRITSKKNRDGSRRPIDEDDIGLAANAGAAIAFRDAIFKVIPGILLKPVFEAAKKVAIGDASTLSDRRLKAIDAFKKMGVSEGRVLASIHHAKVEEISLEDLEALIGTFTAIKEGSLSIDAAFPVAPKKESKKVEKPDLGSQSDVANVADAAPSEPVVTSEGESKGKTAGNACQRLYAEVHEWTTSDPADFVAGLKLIEFPGIQSDAELLSELSEETCEAILRRGVKEIVGQIRDARWNQISK